MWWEQLFLEESREGCLGEEACSDDNNDNVIIVANTVLHYVPMLARSLYTEQERAFWEQETGCARAQDVSQQEQSVGD